MRPLIEVMSEAMHDLGDWNPQESAEYMMGRLRAAGYRILGPDEVDPVTVEKVLVAVNEIAARGYSAAYRGGAMDCDAAIRALGRKA